MSQRRQDARRAEQERRRQDRRNARIQQRRQGRPAAAAPAGAAPSRRVGGSATAVKPVRGRRTLWLAASVAGGVAAIALIAFLILQQRQPLPGERFESNGNVHVTPGEAHGAYFSNPPTSGWHYAEVPKAGEPYSQAAAPEALPHYMEHGGVWVTYTCPDGCDDLVQELRALVIRQTDDKDNPVALTAYPATGRTPPEHRINVLAWQYKLGMDELDRGKINNFIERHACRYNPEGPGFCVAVKGRFQSEPKDAGDVGFNAIAAPPAPTAPAAAPATPVALLPTPPPNPTAAR